MVDPTYLAWIRNTEPKSEELSEQRATGFRYMPKISILVPTYNTPRRYLLPMLNSILNQTYPNWELCIADASDNQETIDLLDIYSKKYNKNIKLTILNKNLGITGNTKEAEKLATGDYIAFLDHDDILPQFALFEVAKAINETDADIIYTNEDKITDDGAFRYDPHFKPIFSPDTLRSYNYICHLAIYKKSLYDEIGGLREGFDGSQDYDLILRATERARLITHIPKVLYHWRATPNSTAENQDYKPYTYDSAKKAISEHLVRIDRKGVVRDGLFKGSYKIEYDLTKQPKVSIIIPNHNECSTLKKCISSIFEKTTYKNYEIIIIENNSTQPELFNYYKQLEKFNPFTDKIKILTWNNPFNYSKINNYGVSHVDGEYILFLNNDTEIISPDWLERMMEYIVRQDVGAVGAKLYYPDNTIQHCGVQLYKKGLAGHPFCKLPGNSLGYMGRAKITQNLSAVTGACLLTKKTVFEKIGRFDENLPLAFNDVELCINIRKANYNIVFTPFAELYHHESKTRGYEDTPEKKKKFFEYVDYVRAKHPDIFRIGDPYFN